MAGSDAVPVILGAAIGAGGAVIAQVTSAVVTAGRERTRLAWEQQRQRFDWAIRTDERFLAQKQELYSNFCALADSFLFYIWKQSREPSPDDDVPLPDSFPELYRLTSNIELMSSREVSEPVVSCRRKIAGAIEAIGSASRSSEERQNASDEAAKAWHKAFDAMRADLTGEQQQIRNLQPFTVGVVGSPKPWWRSVLPW